MKWLKKIQREYHYQKIWTYTNKRLKLSSERPVTDRQRSSHNLRTKANEANLTHHHKRYWTLDKEMKE